MNFAALLRIHDPRAVVLEASVVVAIIGWFDFITPTEVSFFLLYSLPIYFVARNVPRATAFTFAFACWVLCFFINYPGTENKTLHMWRMANRMTAFIFVTAAGTSLKRQKEEFRSRLEAIEHSRELEREIVRVSEREQIRIGQDLHDSVCQNLAALDCATVCLKAQLKNEPQIQVADSIQSLLRRTLAETRSLARGVFPVHVEREGLVVALDDLATTAQRIHGVQVTFELAGEPDDLSLEVSTHLYRIAQEALSNALRHAAADHVVIRAMHTPSRFVLSIQDDGHGFTTPSEQSPGNGMGLQTMRYRARLISAELEVQPVTPRGTIIRCTLPLTQTPSLAA